MKPPPGARATGRGWPAAGAGQGTAPGLARRRLLQAGGLLAAWPGASRAADLLRILLVYPPGGVSDLMLRQLLGPLAELLGQPVQVAYRPGAGGSLGLNALAQARPDGRTLAFTALSPLTLLPLLSPVRYDPLRSFAPVAGVMLTPSLLVGSAIFQGRSVADLDQAACAAPGQLRWATTGVGTTGHLVLAQWQLASGCRVSHVPYKGGGQQLSDALAGHMELLSTNVAAPQLHYIASGRLKALAVGAPQRLAALPEVPTWAELGRPEANLASLFGLLAPAGTPPAELQRLNQAVQLAMAQPALQAALRAADNLPLLGTAQNWAETIRREAEQHRLLLRRAPFKGE